MKRFLTKKQVDLLEQLDDYVEWIELSATATSEDIEYLRRLLDELGESISKSEVAYELDKESPWAEKGYD